MDILREHWKAIPQEPDYFVSSLGRVKNATGRILKSVSWKGWYPIVNLHRRQYRVHRLVASAFVANPERKPQVHHRDNDKCNNVASNLEWVTQRENTVSAAKCGLLSCKKNLRRGRFHGRARSVVQKTVPALEVVAVWPCIAEAAEALGFSQNSINQAAYKNSRGVLNFPRTAHGFVWEYSPAQLERFCNP